MSENTRQKPSGLMHFALLTAYFLQNMASAVYDKNFLLAPKNPTDLLKRLDTAHKLLAGTEQEDDGTVPPGLDNLASALVTPNMLHSKSGEAQLLVCCCLVDVLRLYAPDAPYDGHQKLVSARLTAHQPLPTVFFFVGVPLVCCPPPSPPPPPFSFDLCSFFIFYLLSSISSCPPSVRASPGHIPGHCVPAARAGCEEGWGGRGWGWGGQQQHLPHGAPPVPPGVPGHREVPPHPHGDAPGWGGAGGAGGGPPPHPV